MYGNMENFRFEDIIIGLVVYLILLPFIYFNHRWAMILVCLLYGADKFFLMVQGLGTPISHLIFLMIAVSLTYKSFRGWRRLAGVLVYADERKSL
jgi:hypothetical protein